jgi:hypothetical protein
VSLQPVVVDDAVRFVSREPGLVVLLAILLGTVFFLYLFLRRTILSLREGYDDAREGRR